MSNEHIFKPGIVGVCSCFHKAVHNMMVNEAPAAAAASFAGPTHLLSQRPLTLLWVKAPPHFPSAAVQVIGTENQCGLPLPLRGDPLAQLLFKPPIWGISSPYAYIASSLPKRTPHILPLFRPTPHVAPLSSSVRTARAAPRDQGGPHPRRCHRRLRSRPCPHWRGS